MSELPQVCHLYGLLTSVWNNRDIKSLAQNKQKALKRSSFRKEKDYEKRAVYNDRKLLGSL